MYQLGQKAKDKSTGFTGVIVEILQREKHKVHYTLAAKDPNERFEDKIAVEEDRIILVQEGNGHANDEVWKLNWEPGGEDLGECLGVSKARISEIQEEYLKAANASNRELPANSNPFWQRLLAIPRTAEEAFVVASLGGATVCTHRLLRPAPYAIPPFLRGGKAAHMADMIDLFFNLKNRDSFKG